MIFFLLKFHDFFLHKLELYESMPLKILLLLLLLLLLSLLFFLCVNFHMFAEILMLKVHLKKEEFIRITNLQAKVNCLDKNTKIPLFKPRFLWPAVTLNGKCYKIIDKTIRKKFFLKKKWHTKARKKTHVHKTNIHT